MDWDSAQGILRRGMSLERDGYAFYKLAAERASADRASAMFLDLAAQEADHLHLFLAQYRALEEGRGWLTVDEAMRVDLALDPADPDLPGDEPPGELPVFTSDREISLEGDIAALEYGLETERITRDLYAEAGGKADDETAKEVYRFLASQEEEHYRLLENTHRYLTENETWWDSEQYPFFTG
jgi:rubrerythrin